MIASHYEFNLFCRQKDRRRNRRTDRTGNNSKPRDLSASGACNRKNSSLAFSNSEKLDALKMIAAGLQLPV